MRKTQLTIWCGAALALGLAGCSAERTDDTLADATPEAPVEPAMPPADSMPASPGATAPQRLTVVAGADGAYIAEYTNRRALYLLEADTDGSKCSGPCLAAWPPLLAPAGAPMAAMPPLQADMLGVIQRADGATQVTYNGRPLYRYAKDGIGSTTGQGVDDQWGEWYLVTPQGVALDDEDT